MLSSCFGLRVCKQPATIVEFAFVPVGLVGGVVDLRRRAEDEVLAADHTKLAPALGTRWSQGIPLEVVPHQWPQVAQAVGQLGGRAALRRSRQGQAVVTDQGNSIVDVQFDTFDPAALDSKLAALPGVLATGLFLQIADYAFVGMPDGSTQVLYRQQASVDA